MIWLQSNNIGSIGMNILSDNFHYIPKLKVLNIRLNNIKEEGLIYLSNHLKDIPLLEELNISRIQ